MSRALWRRQLANEWRFALLLTLAPILLLMLLWPEGRLLWPLLELPLFGAALGSLFLSLPRFRRYKLALIETERVLDDPAEETAWADLRQARRPGLLAAALPAWLAALALPTGLNGVALTLLALTSLVLLWLYRIPRQLG